MGALDILLVGVLILALAPIVATDIAQQRAPNLWNLVLGLAGVAGQIARSPHWLTLGRCALVAVLTLTLFLGLIWAGKALRRQGTLGVGDVKFMIAASQWVGFVGGAWVFVAGSLLAGAWALAVAPWRGLDLKRAFAFTPALAAGLLLVFVLSAAGRG